MLNLVAGSLDYIDERSHACGPARSAIDTGRSDHLAFLRAPFLKARELLLKRKAAG
ncbi:hypothetical protein HNP84_005389 [Thermocatellispora tengchongensis]|uniref:Uncharacterized protein n=1 Tax=Thermocatellispora tengchongensis TaxID=1073253 RepID=A0A840PHV3_9ACTN|nr:hypothetical protein [Thermocatellispora tengchongensis]MBB5135645.1 hypothetical protein [Thermocatellispora tengchongensis]